MKSLLVWKLPVMALVILVAGIFIGVWFAQRGDSPTADQEKAQKMMEDTADSIRAWREN